MFCEYFITDALVKPWYSIILVLQMQNRIASEWKPIMSGRLNQSCLIIADPMAKQ